MSNVSYKAQLWPDVVNSYRRLVETHEMPFEPMLALVEEIAASPYAFGLYGNTGMCKLSVVQTQEYDPDGEILQVSYDPAQREFTFELQETTSTLYKRWNRKCSADKAFPTFERFLQLKKWFVGVQKQSL